VYLVKAVKGIGHPKREILLFETWMRFVLLLNRKEYG